MLNEAQHGRWISKTQRRRLDAIRAVLQAERDALDRLTVNPYSQALLREAAPEHYDVLRDYFERRLADLAI
jgi:hypothetical protein